jgi:fatty acid-binding protein DegV
MQVAASFGANLSHTAQGHYGISVAQGHVLVDGVHEAAGAQASIADVDRWRLRAPGLVRVVAASASDWRALFARIARTDPDIIAVASSSTLGPSYREAQAAASALREDPSCGRAAVSVVDTGMSDVALGLLTLVAAEGMRDKVTVSLVLQTLRVLATRTTFTFLAGKLHNMAMSGSPGEASNPRSLFGLVQGEVRALGRIPPKSDPTLELAHFAARAVNNARKVWVGVSHGGCPAEAMRLEEELRRVLPVEYVCRRTLAPTSYVHMGAGALALAVVPLDDLPWRPAVPPDFSETRRPVRRARSLAPL